MKLTARWLLTLGTAACAYGQTEPPAAGAFDACGTLVEGAGCVLFQGGGGSYVVAATSGDFRFGDAVRVVGTLDPACTTICAEADGCIRGATMYDPAVLPCGTHLPEFPQDLITGLCSAAGAALPTLMFLGLLWAGRTRRRPSSTSIQ